MKRQLWLLAILTAIFVSLCLYVSQLQAITITKYPCTPMFLAGPQGRPLPSTVTMVTDLNNNQQTVYIDTLGNGATTNPIVPQNTQMLQFYVDTPGEYITTVTSSGTTKQYWVTCGVGLGAGVARVSIDRNADQINLNTDQPPVQLSSVPDRPFGVIYAPGVDTYGLIDFMMPTRFPLTLKQIQFSWEEIMAPSGGQTVVWFLRWCAYPVGSPACDPDIGTEVTVASTATGSPNRADAIFLGDISWAQNTHVSMAVGRKGTDGRDNNGDEVKLVNIQMEFDR